MCGCEGSRARRPGHRAVLWRLFRAGRQTGRRLDVQLPRPGEQLRKATVLPIIVNNANFVKAEPALLSFDDAATLFHEFGHALHGLLSKVRYPRLSGTNVARDFVELPSQLSNTGWKNPRCWSASPAITRPANPSQTRCWTSCWRREYGQGFATVEFLASALVDMDFHALEPAGPITCRRNRKALARIGMPEEIGTRHAAPHFPMSSPATSYSAGYYAYLWSEVLDADGFEAFEERTIPSTPPPPTALQVHLFGGGTRDFAKPIARFAAAIPRSRRYWKAAACSRPPHEKDILGHSCC